MDQLPSSDASKYRRTRYSNLSEIYTKYGIKPLRGTERIPYSEEESTYCSTGSEEQENVTNSTVCYPSQYNNSWHAYRTSQEENFTKNHWIHLVIQSSEEIINSFYAALNCDNFFRIGNIVITFAFILAKMSIYISLVYRSYKYFQYGAKFVSYAEK